MNGKQLNPLLAFVAFLILFFAWIGYQFISNPPKYK